MMFWSFSALLFICLLLTGLTQGQEEEPAPPAARSSCPQGFGFHGSHCYGLLTPAETWNTAELLCQEYSSGHLVSLLNAAEASFVATMINENNLVGLPVWIGLHDPNQNRRWKWSSNALYVYQAWQKGFPTTTKKNSCVTLTSESKFQTWKDEPCENKYPYICKFKA